MIYVGMATPQIRWDMFGAWMSGGEEGWWYNNPEKL